MPLPQESPKYVLDIISINVHAAKHVSYLMYPLTHD